MNISDNSKGVLLAGLGVLILSPDSVLIRLIDMDLWTLTFFRGLFMGTSLLLLNTLLVRKSTALSWRKIDRYAWGVIVVMAVSAFFFVAAIQTTSVAHTLIITGAVPVVAAIFGLVLLHEKVSLNTWITIAVVVIGLVFVVFDDQQSDLVGDLYAFMACIMLAFTIILARRTKFKNMMLAMSLCGFLMALLALPLADFSAVNSEQILLCLLLGTLVGISFSMLNFAPQFIPAAEVAVFLALETVYGTALVWLVLDEFPGIVSIIAGSIIVSAVMLNSFLSIRKSP